jgi:RNA polymerase sigma factor (sigma-70 family)
MKKRSATLAERHVREFLQTHHFSAATDAELLERFLTRHEESAFAELVQRHGPMVLGLCRRVLRNQHDAEDAFQATFLVLARKGGSIRRPGSLASWLFHVAQRVARRARANADRRRLREAQIASPETCSNPESTEADTRAILADELSRLPEKYRQAVVLCYLEGRTHAEAARDLGATAGAITGNLRRARDLLRQRLRRRGLDLASGTVVGLLVQDVAAVPAALEATTARAGLSFVADGAAGLVGSQVFTLAQGTLKTMARGKILAAISLVLTILATGAGLFSRQAPADKPQVTEVREVVAATTDLSGDPLPSGALTRLGTVRWRHGGPVFFAAYSLDNRELITVGQDGFVRVWESATGKEIRRYGTGEVGTLSGAAISADRKLLATSSKDGAITLWDVVQGSRHAPRAVRLGIPSGDGTRSVPATLGDGTRSVPATFSRVNELLFSPDGKYLVARDGCAALRLYDVTSGKEVRKFVPGKDTNIRIVEHWVRSRSVAFAPDGKTLFFGTPAFVGGAETNVFWRFDVVSGKELEVIKGPPGLRNSGSPLALAPDGKTWAWSDFGGPLRIWDSETGRVLHNLDRHVRDFADLVFSADSKQLIAGSNLGPGARVWDVASGKEVRRFGGFGTHTGRLAVSNLALSADGKTLAVGNDHNTVQQWDLSTGKELLAGPGHQGPVTAVELSADGKTVATRGLDDTVRFWNSASGSEFSSIPLPGDALRDIYSLAFTTNERLLVMGLGLNDSIHSIFDIKTSKRVGDWQLGVGVTNLALSPDSRVLASRWRDGAIRVHDALTGKVLQQMQGEGQVSGVLCDIDRHPNRMAFSPDGSTLAVAALGQLYCGRSKVQGMKLIHVYEAVSKPIVLWDMRTGKQLRQIDTGKHVVSRLVFSPDGRTIATINREDTITLWEMASGKERFSFPSTEAHNLLTFTPDGRTLLAAGDASPIIHVYSIRTGKELAQLKGHGGPVTALAVREKVLVSTSTDTTALVWNLAGLNHEQPAVVELDEARTEALWHDLGSADARKAYQAIRTLSAAARQALPLLRQRIRPLDPPDGDKLTRLIADLDSPQFAVRQRASAELARIGDLAAVALQKAHDDRPTLEMRRQIDRLLDRLVTTQELPADLLRALRALEVLEQLNTLEARETVAGIARGAAGARLTRKAQETLNRMR